ncbi:dimethylarginine dimethylaminohydrolase family protein [Alteribacillus bidgolensis]|uniref:N-Dimethylarginine dimethylaminohydrolase n=1 Tax=Alteribacillus bidgolensis TaxID=930129 RepID=A0A1G8MIT8_9BACI|nr:arginine deiminase family protein [Alteribacillus bidgolensis]SDI67812.1 N-Dimethylarginine dimethylaminohydrolase [Alteribacillus bidgolensis]
MTNKRQGSAYTEYGVLKEVLMCSPEEMRIKKPINEVQKSYEDENIDQDKAIEEHQFLIETLKNHGVTVQLIPALSKLPEQVFTRDLGFATEKGIITGKMETDIREPEIKEFKSWLQDHHWDYLSINDGSIEGGDVLIDEDVIYVGDSSRTSEQAVKQLEELFPAKKIITIPFDKKYLHLDCIFNILSPGTALLYPDALSNDIVRDICMRYRTITVTEEEQFRLGTNVLSIGNKTVISLPENKKVNEDMKEMGFEVLEIPFSEIIKSGGSFRCVTMPLIKGK